MGSVGGEVVEGVVVEGEGVEGEGVEGEGEGVNVVIKDIVGGLSEWADTVDPSFPKY